jgi:hypothetical protein
MNAQISMSKDQLQLGREQMAFQKDLYNQNKPYIDQIAQSAINRQKTNDQNAASDRARYQQEFQPLENQLVSDANSYATPARENYDMGRAQAQVSQQFDQQRQAAARNLEGFGVDPSSTRYAALDAGMRVQQAAAGAAAGNQARMQTEGLGRAMRSEAINVGRGYPGQIAQTYGTALQSGNQGANTMFANAQTAASTMGSPTQWYGGAGGSLSGAANTMNAGYANQLAAFNAEQNASSGLGGLFGSVLGAAGNAGGFGKLFTFAAEGGAIPDTTPGGNVSAAASPSGGKAIDDVPARLTAGEFVLPKDVVQWKGEEWAQKEIEKARKAKAQVQAKPEMKPAIDAPPTFTSRPSALPVG